MPLTGGLAVLAALQVSLVQVGPAADVRTAFTPAPSAPQLTGIPWTLRVGPQRPDLVRYNRVEAFSLGVRAQLRPSTPLGPVSVTATGRFGLGDLHPNGRLEIARETVARRVMVSGYHELAAMEGQPRPLGPANSLTALLWGRDYGDYYRRSGASVELTPPSARPRVYRLRAFAEYQEPVEKETDVQLPRLWDDDRVFRPNFVIDEGWVVGAALDVAGRSGTDPTRTRGGFLSSIELGYGDFDYQRLSAGVDATLMLTRRLGFTLEVAAGTVHGSPPVQRLWYVGGPLSLRGYGPLAVGGDSFWRGRAEVSRRYSFGQILVFSDVGWAGARDIRITENVLYSAGAGLAVIDGILRIDGAWQLQGPRDFRLDVYLGQVL
ncbi:MAG: hypothetical protein PVJ80_04770 [Gemmatimonadota bacterium]